METTFENPSSLKLINTAGQVLRFLCTGNIVVIICHTEYIRQYGKIRIAYLQVTKNECTNFLWKVSCQIDNEHLHHFLKIPVRIV